MNAVCERAEALWDALFLSAAEVWTKDQVSNTTASEALELGHVSKGPDYQQAVALRRDLRDVRSSTLQHLGAQLHSKLPLRAAYIPRRPNPNQ